MDTRDSRARVGARVSPTTCKQIGNNDIAICPLARRDVCARSVRDRMPYLHARPQQVRKLTVTAASQIALKWIGDHLLIPHFLQRTRR